MTASSLCQNNTTLPVYIIKDSFITLYASCAALLNYLHSKVGNKFFNTFWKIYFEHLTQSNTCLAQMMLNVFNSNEEWKCCSKYVKICFFDAVISMFHFSIKWLVLVAAFLTNPYEIENARISIHMFVKKSAKVSQYWRPTHIPLHWRHNGCDSVSNHQPRGCLLNRLFRRRSKKTSELPVTGLCVAPSLLVPFVHKGPVTRKMFPFDDVIMLTNGELQRPQWIPGQSPWRTSRFCVNFTFMFDVVNPNIEHDDVIK